jgi:hypothetical protein
LNINIPVIQHSILACVWYKQVAIKRFMISINCRISGMLTYEFIPERTGRIAGHGAAPP